MIFSLNQSRNQEKNTVFSHSCNIWKIFLFGRRENNDKIIVIVFLLYSSMIWGRTASVNKTKQLIISQSLKKKNLWPGSEVFILHGSHLVKPPHARSQLVWSEVSLAEGLICNEHSCTNCLCPVTGSYQVKNGSCKVIQCWKGRDTFIELSEIDGNSGTLMTMICFKFQRCLSSFIWNVALSLGLFTLSG